MPFRNNDLTMCAALSTVNRDHLGADYAESQAILSTAGCA